jgi:hypothetical protein
VTLAETSDRDLQRDFVERHTRCLHCTRAARTFSDAHQAVSLQDPNIHLDVFQVARRDLGQFVDRLRLAALDGVKQRKTLARQEIAGRLKASESNSFLRFDMTTGPP